MALLLTQVEVFDFIGFFYHYRCFLWFESRKILNVHIKVKFFKCFTISSNIRHFEI